MNLLFFRAILGMALFFSTVSIAKVQTKTVKSETYKDLIEKAYNLSLQKDRQQALNILSSAIQREVRPQALMELKRTASEVATVFLSDKAQQLFETGVSLRKTDLNQAFDKLNESLRTEPDNSSIVTEAARVLIARGDCKNAQEIVQKQLLLINFDEDLKLSLAQTLVCQEKWQEYQKIVDSVAFKKSPQQKFWWILEIDKYLSTKSLLKAQESLNILKKIDDKYPEVSYWIWKLGHIQKKPNHLEGQKYVMTCKNISANQYRQYMIDPMLCRHLNEVEGELKGTHGTTD